MQNAAADPSAATAAVMNAAKPASKAARAPASSAASKAKTSKATPTQGGGEEKKKRKKARKETYSSYIYKGLSCINLPFTCADSGVQFSSKFTLILVSRTKRWQPLIRLSTTCLKESQMKQAVSRVCDPTGSLAHQYFRACLIQQEVYHLVQGDTDCSASYSSR